MVWTLREKHKIYHIEQSLKKKSYAGITFCIKLGH